MTESRMEVPRKTLHKARGEPSELLIGYLRPYYMNQSGSGHGEGTGAFIQPQAVYTSIEPGADDTKTISLVFGTLERYYLI